MSMARHSGRLLADTAGLSAALLFAVIAGWQALGYGLWNGFEPAPGLFPFLVCAMAGVCAMFALAGIVIDYRLGIEPEAEEVAMGPLLWRKILVYIAVLLLWPLAFAPLGWLLSTGLGLLLLMRFAEHMSWRASVVTTTCALLASWLLFVRLLEVPLPRGVLG